MGKLLDALHEHEYSDAKFKIGGKEIDVKVKIFNSEDYKKELEALCSDDEKANASRLASYFMEPGTLLPAFSAEELLSPKIKNRDIKALLDLFVKVNNGAEGN